MEDQGKVDMQEVMKNFSCVIGSIWLARKKNAPPLFHLKGTDASKAFSTIHHPQRGTRQVLFPYFQNRLRHMVKRLLRVIDVFSVRRFHYFLADFSFTQTLFHNIGGA